MIAGIDQQTISTPAGVHAAVNALVVANTEATNTDTGTQNNVSLAGASLLRFNNASLLTITGFAAGAAGQRLTIVSVGAGQVDLSNQSGSSTDVNRIINGVTGTISLAAGSGRAVLIYDATTQRWRVIEHEQGAWITPAYNSGDFIGSGSMTWTVASGDVRTYSYLLKGRTLMVSFDLFDTTVGGTLSTVLQVKIPAGFVSVRTVISSMWLANAGAGESGLSVVNVADVWLYLLRAAQTNWSSATNTTRVSGQLSFDVQ